MSEIVGRTLEEKPDRNVPERRVLVVADDPSVASSVIISIREASSEHEIFQFDAEEDAIGWLDRWYPRGNMVDVVIAEARLNPGRGLHVSSHIRKLEGAIGLSPAKLCLITNRTDADEESAARRLEALILPSPSRADHGFHQALGL